MKEGVEIRKPPKVLPQLRVTSLGSLVYSITTNHSSSQSPTNKKRRKLNNNLWVGEEDERNTEEIKKSWWWWSYIINLINKESIGGCKK